MQMMQQLNETTTNTNKTLDININGLPPGATFNTDDDDLTPNITSTFAF